MSSSQSCNHGPKHSALPPALDSFDATINTFPHVTPNLDVNRSIPRCFMCDRVAAIHRANDAMQPLFKVRKDIELAKALIHEGVRKEELAKTLPAMEDRRNQAIDTCSAGTKNAWMRYWSIWGVLSGQVWSVDEILELFKIKKHGLDIIDRYYVGLVADAKQYK